MNGKRNGYRALLTLVLAAVGMALFAPASPASAYGGSAAAAVTAAGDIEPAACSSYVATPQRFNNPNRVIGWAGSSGCSGWYFQAQLQRALYAGPVIIGWKVLDGTEWTNNADRELIQPCSGTTGTTYTFRVVLWGTNVVGTSSKESDTARIVCQGA